MTVISDEEITRIRALPKDERLCEYLKHKCKEASARVKNHDSCKNITMRH